MVIYQITNQVTNDTYIGKTINKIQVRFYHHKYNALHKKSQTYLHRAIRKYGMESFIITIIEDITHKELLNEREMFWIEKLSPKYNMTTGGDGGDVSKSEKFINSQKNKSYKHSEETKNKIRQAHLGKSKPPISEEHKNKISQGNLGRKRPPRSNEWKRKQSESQKGKIPWNKGLKCLIT